MMFRILIVPQIISWIFFYVAGAFISLESSVFEWTEGGRAALAVVGITTGFAISVCRLADNTHRRRIGKNSS